MDALEHPNFFAAGAKILPPGAVSLQFSEISSNSPKLAPSKVLASMHVVNHAWSSQDSPRFPKIPLSDLYAEPPGGPGPPGPLLFVFVFPHPPAPFRSPGLTHIERSKTHGLSDGTDTNTADVCVYVYVSL